MAHPRLDPTTYYSSLVYFGSSLQDRDILHCQASGPTHAPPKWPYLGSGATYAATPETSDCFGLGGGRVLPTGLELHHVPSRGSTSMGNNLVCPEITSYSVVPCSRSEDYYVSLLAQDLYCSEDLLCLSMNKASLQRTIYKTALREGVDKKIDAHWIQRFSEMLD